MSVLFLFFLAAFALLWGVALAVLWLMKRWVLAHLDMTALLASNGDAIDALLEAKLDALVLLFKQQIPMASTFLVGPLVEKLKGQAHGELMTLLPEIEEALSDKRRLTACVERQLPKIPLLLITAAAAMIIALVLTGLLLLIQ